MAESSLVEVLKEDGQELIQHLVRDDLFITVAWWVKPLEEREFLFYLACPAVDNIGPGFAYQKVYKALRSMQHGDAFLARVSLGQIKVIGVNNPITADVLKIISRYGGRPPIYVARCHLGELEAEEVYIYPQPNAATWQMMKLKSSVEVDDPLPPQETQAMNEIVASGVNPTQAAYWFLRKHAEEKPKSRFPEGSVVKGWVVGSPNDPNPLVLFLTQDGKQGFTPKSNTEPVPNGPGPRQ
jgi:hypothetical protein